MPDEVTPKPNRELERIENLMRRGLVSWREYNELLALVADAWGRTVALGYKRGCGDRDKARQVVAIREEYEARRGAILKFATERCEGGHYMINGQWTTRASFRYTKHERAAARELVEAL